jgi:ABC-2 type transport system permease protein
MHAVWVLANREFRSFLRSPLGYAILAVHALASGLILVTLLYLFREQLLMAAQTASRTMRTPPGLSVQLSVVAPYFLNVASQLLFVLPFVTMRSLAEERRTRSLELLTSYPLRVWQIVLGKYLGVLLFSLLLLGVSAVHMVVLALVSTPAAWPVIGGLLGLLLFVAALLAIGVFISSLAMGQVEAAVLTLGLFLVLAMASGVARPGSTWVQTLLANLSPLYHYAGFGQGLLAPGAIGYFLAAIVLFLALSARGVDLIKWRG